MGEEADAIRYGAGSLWLSGRASIGLDRQIRGRKRDDLATACLSLSEQQCHRRCHNFVAK